MGLESSVQLALIVAIPTFIAPLLTLWLQNYGARQQKLIDAEIRRTETNSANERADRIAARAEGTAAKAAESARALRVTMNAANTAGAEASRNTNEKLDVIHSLVNSNMTAAMQSELDARVTAVLLMQEIIALKRASGQEPSLEATAEVDAAKAKILELKANLAKRRDV